MSRSTKSGTSAKPKTSTSVDAQLWTALKHSDVEALRELLFDRLVDPETGGTHDAPNAMAKKAVNSLNAKKQLPLSFAVGQGLDEEIVHLLLRAGANINDREQTREQSTALHTACWGSDDVLVQLLLRCGADLSVVDAEGRTPLHILCTVNASNLLAYVLEAVMVPPPRVEGLLYLKGRLPLVLDPVDVLMKQDVMGATALHTALEELALGSANVVEVMLDFIETKLAEAAPDDDITSGRIRQLLNLTTHTKWNALHMAFSSADVSEGTLCPTLQRLLRLGANPLAVNDEGRTPLAVAIEKCRSSSKPFQILLQAMTESCAKRQETVDTSVSSMQDVFTRHDDCGRALVHIAVAERNIHALEAMCAFVKAHMEDGKNVARQWLGDVCTADGIQTVGMLAAREVEDMASLLVNLGAIDQENYDALKLLHAAEREREHCEAEQQTEDNSTKEDRSTSTGDFRGFGSTGVSSGAKIAGSRVQRARRSRASAHAARKGRHEKHLDTAPSVNAQGNGISTQVKILGVLLLLSVLFASYTVWK